MAMYDDTTLERDPCVSLHRVPSACEGRHITRIRALMLLDLDEDDAPAHNDAKLAGVVMRCQMALKAYLTDYRADPNECRKKWIVTVSVAHENATETA